MLFNSIDFALFLPIVFAFFWLAERRSYRLGNLLLVAASAFFYGWWDWRFLGLVLISGILDYVASIKIEGSSDRSTRKFFLALSIIGNLGILGFFKYHDFFVTAFTDAFSLFGTQLNVRSLSLILPVGISFYTFQSLSYTIDVYRGHLKPSHDPLEFGAYLIFFPQLVAGPIERATNLLPQFQRRRFFDMKNAVDGSRQMLWGLFKKVVIADQCAPIVDRIFADPSSSSGNMLVLGAVLFAFQIYGDFSGYSDIAIGCARLFGFDLMRNFAYPYFSRDIAEFWRRWHISLSTWFRDYLYIPLGGSRGNLKIRIRNVFIIFLVSGFWHGANYTFIAWGAIHATLFLPMLLRGTNRRNTDIAAQGSLLPNGREALAMLGTFLITTIAWVFFRARDLPTAFEYLGTIALDYASHPGQLLFLPYVAYIKAPLIMILIMLILEWLQREKRHALEHLEFKFNWALRWSSYYALLLVILYHFGEEQTFIYFQF